jgi:2'-phosphotransferase
LKEVKVDMIEINNSKELENCIHGTYLRHWESIKRQGLSRMNRQHIHFTTAYLGADTVISGMRSNCQLAIHIDTDKALKDGIKFYKSENGVILTEGNEQGLLLPKYFLKVVNLKTSRLLSFSLSLCF